MYAKYRQYIKRKYQIFYKRRPRKLKSLHDIYKNHQCILKTKSLKTF